MNQGADVTAVLGWGLRRYAWLIALFVVALGVVVPGLIGQRGEEYQAKAQVGPGPLACASPMSTCCRSWPPTCSTTS